MRDVKEETMSDPICVAVALAAALAVTALVALLVLAATAVWWCRVAHEADPPIRPSPGTDGEWP